MTAPAEKRAGANAPRCRACDARTTRARVPRRIPVGRYVVTAPQWVWRCADPTHQQTTAEDAGLHGRVCVRAVLTSRPNPGGEVYKLARHALGARQTELAKALGVAAETLSRWENDREPMPRIAQLALVALLGMHDANDALVTIESTARSEVA